jgi:predicted DNA-binding transcriptional regulator AlpA
MNIDDIEDRYLTSAQVRHRYGGRSDMALWRWLHDKGLGFPQPVEMSGRRYWRFSDLQRFEAECVARKTRLVSEKQGTRKSWTVA